MEEAKRQKDKFMGVIRQIHPDVVEIVDIDDLCENGILYETEKIPRWWRSSRRRGSTPCSRPTATLARSSARLGVAAALKVPTLMWGRPGRAAQHGREPGPGYPVRDVRLHQGDEAVRGAVQLHLELRDGERGLQAGL